MKLERFGSADEVAARCAELVQATLAAEPEAVLCLPAGRTPLPLFAELALRSRAGELDLGRAHLFQLDELLGVADDDPRGFHDFLVANLLDPAGVARTEHLHLLDGRAADPDAQIAAHAARLAELGGAHLAVLGIGTNGHIAFNEPGSQRADGARRVTLAEPTLRGLSHVFGQDELPAQGITLGVRELRAARRVVLLATGVSKAGVLAALLGDGDPDVLPAAHFRDHPDFVVLADAAACAELSPASGP